MRGAAAATRRHWRRCTRWRRSSRPRYLTLTLTLALTLTLTPNPNPNPNPNQVVASEIRARVKEATGGLTTSAGLAHNFMLAKIAADQRKPDGQFCPGWSRDEGLAFVALG